jgi:hypothetical protein
MTIRASFALTALFAALCVVPASALAQVYKWKDDKGVTHYGERPAGKDAQPLTLVDPTSGPPQQPDDPAAKTKAKRSGRTNESDLERKEREFQKRREARLREEERARRERQAQDTPSARRERMSECRTATQDLATMRRNPTIYSYAERDRAQDRISRYCP